MTRRLLLSAGSGSETSGPPPDPDVIDESLLTALRHITDVSGFNAAGAFSGGTDGTTWRSVAMRAAEDFNRLTLVYSNFASDHTPWVAAVALERLDGTLIPVTWDGNANMSCPLNAGVESDELDVLIRRGETFRIRLHTPGLKNVPTIGSDSPIGKWAGVHLSESWDLSRNGTHDSPLPVAVLGHTYPALVSPALWGDSIAMFGGYPGGWWRKALYDTSRTPGMAFGVSGQKFTNIDDRDGAAIRAATHIVVQYGVNDLVGSPAIAGVWADARAAYANLNTRAPGVPLWQTTVTPTATTTDAGATLSGQTPVDNAVHQTWNAFLRDGAPIHPTTKAMLTPGATGLRAGQEGHPLRGIIDVAATVEQGGSSAPTGKWRVGTGAVPWTYDGTHPTQAGQDQMGTAITAWRSTL